MEPYYYTKLNKQHQAVYHAMQQCLISLADEWQMPRVSGEALYNIFFQLRLDHPEIFWATGFKYRYYENSGNLIFLPEYLFEKAKIREHQKAMASRVEKLVRPAAKLSELEKEQASVIRMEAQGNWLQKSWRPLVMLCFTFIILLGVFIPIPLLDDNSEFWNLLEIGLGGYIIGRSVEKVTGKIRKI